jgi:hypothetical protein
MGGGTPKSLLKYSKMPHAKDAKDAKFSGKISLCDLCDLCVRLFQQSPNAQRRTPNAPRLTVAATTPETSL